MEIRLSIERESQQGSRFYRMHTCGREPPKPDALVV